MDYKFDGIYSISDMSKLIGCSNSWVRSWLNKLAISADHEIAHGILVKKCYSFHVLIALLNCYKMRQANYSSKDICKLINDSPLGPALLLSQEFIRQASGILDLSDYYWDENKILQEWYPAPGACVAGYRCFGRPTIKNHRIQLESIALRQSHGETLKDQQAEYAITCSYGELMQAVRWYKQL